MRYLLIILLLIGCKKDEVKPVEQVPAKVTVQVMYGVYLWFDTVQPRYYLESVKVDKGSTFKATIELIDDTNIKYNGVLRPIEYNVQTPYHFCIWVYVNGKQKYKVESKNHKINLEL